MNKPGRAGIKQGGIRRDKKGERPVPRTAAASKTGAVPLTGRFHRWLANHQMVAVDALLRLLQQFGSSLMIWLVIGLALALPLGMSLGLLNLQNLGADQQNGVQISLFLDMGLPEREILAVRDSLQQEPAVAAVDYLSADQALAEFEALSGFGDVLAGLEENPLPAVLRVKPRGEDAREVETLYQDLQSLSGVDSALLDMRWVERFYSLLALARRLSLVFGVMLAAGVLLVMANTIKMAIEARRSEIVVVKLVGGTDSFVARPFLYTGFWYGAGGGLIAWCLLQGSLFWLDGTVSRLAGLYESSYELIGLGLSGLVLLLLGGGLLGWLGAGVAVLKHLRAIEPD